MEKILKVHSVNDYARYIGAEELHPLFSVIHYDELEHCRHSLNNYDVYGIFIADVRLDSLTYGLVNYDLHRHALMCVAPGQIGGKTDEGEEIQTRGWALLFDPALLSGTELAHRMSAYTYFSYNTSEALLMSEEERGIIVGLFEDIRTEAKGDASPRILVAYLTLVLEYIARFYNRQLSTSTKETANLLSRFETLLTQYYDRRVYQSQGLPSVKYCAQELFLSPNYSCDLSRRTFFMNLLANQQLKARYYHYLDVLCNQYILGGEFSKTLDAINGEIGDVAGTEANAFYTNEQFHEAQKILQLVLEKRAASVLGQMKGEIPATWENQKAQPQLLINSDDINLQDLGGI